MTLCPVCLRPVAVSAARHVVFAHHDGCGRNCPMSGHPLGGDMSDRGETVNA